MAVISCQEIQDGRTGSRDEKGYRRYTRCWHVRTDTVDDGPLSATDTGSLPLMWSSYSAGNDVDDWAIVIGYDVQPFQATDTFVDWKVTVTYSSAPIDFGATGTTDGDTISDPTSPSQQSGETAPEDRPWSISTTCKTTEVPLKFSKDGAMGADGTPVLNAAGVPFDPPVMVPRSNLLINLSGYTNRSFATSFANAAFFADCINSEPYLGLAARTLRVNKYDPQMRFERGSYTTQLTIELEYKADFWNPVKVLNAGCVQKITNGKPLEPCKDSSGNPVQTPVPLDATGKQLAAGGTPIYLEFLGYVETSFAGLIG